MNSSTANLAAEAHSDIITVHIEVGDFLEVVVDDDKITFTPKSFIDRRLADALEDLRMGRTHGPYASAEEAMAALEARAAAYSKKPRR